MNLGIHEARRAGSSLAQAARPGYGRDGMSAACRAALPVSTPRALTRPWKTHDMRTSAKVMQAPAKVMQGAFGGCPEHLGAKALALCTM